MAKLNDHLAYQYVLKTLTIFRVSIVLGDRPLIVQFAANNGKDMADASEIVFP